MVGMKTLEDAAAELGLRVVTLLNEHKKGNLPLVIVGKLRFVKITTLEEWLASKEVAKPVRRTMSEDHKNRLKAAGAARRARNALEKAS
jgi:hypothetical protein